MTPRFDPSRFVLHEPEAPKVRQLPEVPASSRYRCREHDVPVTWRGTGCHGCEYAAKRRAEREVERKSRRRRTHGA